MWILSQVCLLVSFHPDFGVIFFSFFALGASRYRAAPTTSGGEGQYMDPFTGASRYVAPPPGGTPSPSGSTRHTSTPQPAAASKPAPPVAKIIPAVCRSPVSS
jgi:hypothetical protein